MGGEQHVPDEERVWRRVSISNPTMIRYDSETRKELGPSSAAFVPHDDGVSVYVRGILNSLCVPVEGVAVDASDSVWELDVEDIRRIGLDILPDAWPEGIANAGHPRNAAHALIVGWDGLSKGQCKKKQKELSKLATKCLYDPRSKGSQ